MAVVFVERKSISSRLQWYYTQKPLASISFPRHVLRVCPSSTSLRLTAGTLQAGSFNNLVLDTAPILPPSATEVLVKVHAVSLQYRDLLVPSGKYFTPPAPNLIPCSDMAGEVVAVGEGVRDWKVGDRVCANFAPDHIYGDITPEIAAGAHGATTHGVLSEYRSFPSHALVPIPEGLSYEEASTLPCAALTAYNALHGPVPVKAGDTVLLLGTGGVSIFALQFASVLGAKTIVTSSSDVKLEHCKNLGATHLVNYKTHPDWEQEVLKLTNGIGVDHVVEVGGTGTLSKSIACVRAGGHIHVVGVLSPALDKEDVPIVYSLIGKSITLRGLLVGPVALFKEMNRVIAANLEATRPSIDSVFPFEAAKDAFAHLESQKHVGKVVIKVASS